MGRRAAMHRGSTFHGRENTSEESEILKNDDWKRRVEHGRTSKDQ